MAKKDTSGREIVDSRRQGSGDDDFWQDLHPNFLAGENHGLEGPHPELNAKTAYDVKEVHQLLVGFSDEELEQIPILPAGSRLEQGAIYLDLHELSRGEIKATADIEAGPENWYTPKTSVPYWIWNRLTGVRIG